MSTKEQIKDLAQTTFKNHLDFLSLGQIEKWVDLFTEDGVLEFPYGPADFPGLVKGKTELYEYMKNFLNILRLILKIYIFMPPKNLLWSLPNLQAKEMRSAPENLIIKSTFLW